MILPRWQRKLVPWKEPPPGAARGGVSTLRGNAGSSDMSGLSSERGSASIFSHPQSSSFAVNMVGENTNALAIELVKQFPSFKFSGERCDFQNWQDQWEDYVQLVRQVYGETSSYVLLSLLRDKMDNVTGKEITLRMREPQVKYDEVYAEICRRFGEVGTGGRRWKRIRLARTSQGVSLAEWRRFRVEWLSAVSQSFGRMGPPLGSMCWCNSQSHGGWQWLSRK